MIMFQNLERLRDSRPKLSDETICLLLQNKSQTRKTARITWIFFGQGLHGKQRRKKTGDHEKLKCEHVVKEE